MDRFYIHQIYYNDDTRRMLDPGFLALDNMSNARPDWYEFWPIRRFLLTTPLEADAWYGFLSPNFRVKTGLDSGQVLRYMTQCAPHVDVALFSPGWDQTAYFLNPFEQGEVSHPGLLDTSQRFFDAIGLQIDLRTLVTDASSTVFCNYIVAKPVFWREWLRLANALFDFSEDARHPLSPELNRTTLYDSQSRPSGMKVFIQERLASLLLATGDFKVAAPDFSDQVPLTTVLFANDLRARRLLQSCETLKQQFRATGDADYLNAYRKLRARVPATSFLRQFRLFDVGA